MNLCNYSDIFGKPNTGLHKIRIYDLAIVDIFLTFVFAYVIYYYVNKKYNYNVHYLVYVVTMFVIGIIMHRLFCVRTTVDNYLFE